MKALSKQFRFTTLRLPRVFAAGIMFFAPVLTASGVGVPQKAGDTTEAKSRPPSGTSAASNNLLASLVAKLAEQAGGGVEKYRIGVGRFIHVGKFDGEDDASLSEIADRLREDLELALIKASTFSVVTRDRLADLQNEWNLQERDILDPGSRVQNASIKGVDCIVRGKFFPAADGLELFAELVFVKGGDVRKEKITLPMTRFGRRPAGAPALKMNELEIETRARAIAEGLTRERETKGIQPKMQGVGNDPGQQENAPKPSSNHFKKKSVFIVGDNVLSALMPWDTDFAFSIIGATNWIVEINAKPGRRATTQGIIAPEINEEAPESVSDVLKNRSSKKGGAVVVMIGHNDERNIAFQKKIQSINSQLSGCPQVFWITMREISESYKRANQMIKIEAAYHKNVRIIDWDAESKLQSSWVAPDGVHLKTDGAKALALLILKHLNSCYD